VTTSLNTRSSMISLPVSALRHTARARYQVIRTRLMNRSVCAVGLMGAVFPAGPCLIDTEPCTPLTSYGGNQMSKIVMLLATTLLMTAPAYTQSQSSMAGKWTGEAQGRNGTQQVVLDLKESGGTLTGAMTTGDNPAVDIKDATVSGTKISFNTTRSIQGYDITIKWTGEAKGDDLTLTREITNLPAGAPAGNGSPPPVTLKRAK
jgi:hypothetical protein